MIPGSDILDMALQSIAPQTALWWRANSRTQAANGAWITSYDDPVQIVGSIQPVRRKLYQQNGLDFNKRYITIYSSNPMIGPERGTGGDQISWNEGQWELVPDTDWFAQDGWMGALASYVGLEKPFIPYTFGFDADHANFDNGNFNDA